MKLIVQACEVTTPMLIFKSIIGPYAHCIQNLPPEFAPSSACNVTLGGV